MMTVFVMMSLPAVIIIILTNNNNVNSAVNMVESL